ncbi:MAG: class I SAM-dependent methyltransferase [bacterium]
MNWSKLRSFLWIDTRFNFIGKLPMGGNLLDLGSSDGETLNHFHEARPDLHLYSSDIEGKPENYPAATSFQRADITADHLPWDNESMDGITSMHLVEHISSFDNFFKQANRLLKTGAKFYIETPHPKTQYLISKNTDKAIKFTYNFWDDSTHVQIVPVEKLAEVALNYGFEVKKTGVSRNLLFGFSYLFSFLLSPRKKMIAKVHFIGWSSYIVLKKTSTHLS